MKGYQRCAERILSSSPGPVSPVQATNAVTRDRDQFGFGCPLQFSHIFHTRILHHITDMPALISMITAQNKD